MPDYSSPHHDHDDCDAAVPIVSEAGVRVEQRIDAQGRRYVLAKRDDLSAVMWMAATLAP